MYVGVEGVTCSLHGTYFMGEVHSLGFERCCRNATLFTMTGERQQKFVLNGELFLNHKVCNLA